MTFINSALLSCYVKENNQSCIKVHVRSLSLFAW